MLNRLKFWGASLAQGAVKLNDAAGWLGTVILILGVAAGIAIPLVLKLSLWLIAVVLLGLLILILLEGTYRVWRATNQKLGAAEQEMQSRFAAIRHAIKIIEISPILPRKQDSMDVQIEMMLKNTSNEYVRYKLESVATVIEGRVSSDHPSFAASVVIPPHETDSFVPPAVVDAPLRWRTGSLSLTILYGDASGPPRYRAHWEYAIQGGPDPRVPAGPTDAVRMVLAKDLDVTEISEDSQLPLAQGSRDSSPSNLTGANGFAVEDQIQGGAPGA